MEKPERISRAETARRYHQKKKNEGYKHFLLSPREANVIVKMRESKKGNDK